MEKININYSKDTIYHEVLDNGLNIYLLPSNKMDGYQISLSVLYGARDINYVIDDKLVNDPDGTAHYLEHQLFNMDDEDSFNYFSKTGTIANAGTSRLATKYYIYGNRDMLRNLNYFIKMIFTPVFTDESVNKELGIIAEEIKMYDDDDHSNLDNRVRKNIFHNHDLNLKIAGSVESIKKINKDILERAYHYFYIPKNMVLTINGDFKIDTILKSLHNNKLLNQNNNHEIIRGNSKESSDVVKEYSMITGNSEIPKLSYAFKINKDLFNIDDDYLLNRYISLIIRTNFNDLSLFHEDVINNQDCYIYDYEISNVDNYFIIEFYAESDKGDMFKDKVDAYLTKLKVEQEDLERYKKEILSSEIFLSDRITDITNHIHEDYSLYNKAYFNISNYVNKLDLKVCQDILKKLDFSNQTFVLMFNEKINE